MRRFTLFSFTSLVVTALLSGCTQLPPPKLIYKPVNLGEQRIKLTRKFRCKNYMLCDRSVTIKPQMIVLHSTATRSWREAYNNFKQANHKGELNTSAQFLVARTGTVYQLMPSNWMTSHVNGLDHVAINIDNVGGSDGKQNLTDAQVNSDVYLITMLKKQYPSINYLIGHYEYRCFRDTPLWKQQDTKNNTDIVDPGPIFMRAVRERVANLELIGCGQ